MGHRKTRESHSQAMRRVHAKELRQERAGIASQKMKSEWGGKITRSSLEVV